MPSRWHVSRAAMTASGEQHARSALGPAGSSHRRSVTPTAFGNARSSATALSTPPLIATAVRPVERSARKTEPSAFASASTASVSPDTAAASSSVRPARDRSSPGASASTIRSPSTVSRTAAHSPSRVESPKHSVMRKGGPGPREPVETGGYPAAAKTDAGSLHGAVGSPFGPDPGHSLAGEAPLHALCSLHAEERGETGGQVQLAAGRDVAAVDH